MSINLDKFKYDLVEGWREVMDSKNPIDWAIFGYDGQSFDLKLATKGSGGLDEMVDNFNSGRIMYGLCRVKIKDRNVEKIVLVNWQGEGAPLARKGTCANHVTTVKNFFKGVHVTINARTDEDVDPNVILESVAKATSAEGIRMSSSIEMDTKTEPVGAAYKRVNPKEEINARAKDEFWAKEEAEEESRKKVEKNRMSKFSQNEVKLLRKESQDYFEQEQLEKTLTPIPTPSPTPTPNVPISTNGDTLLNNGSRDSVSPTSPPISNAFMATEKAAVLKASIPRKNPTENLVRQRIKSFDGNPNESLLSFNQATTNGGGGFCSSSKSPNGGDGETLSVMKRKQMFESGAVSNISQSIVRKDPAQEIKALQEESLKSVASVAQVAPHDDENQKSAASVAHASLEHRVVKSPPPPPTTGVTTTNPVQKSSNPPTATKTSNQVKAYNLPFHIGGSVSSRLAEKVNKNTGGETNGGNVNGNSLSSLESSSTASSKNSVLTQQPAVGSTCIKAEFTAAPIPQHITTNFEIPKSNTENRVPVKSPSPRPSPSPISDGGKQENEIEDTTVQSGEPPKNPSPAPPVSSVVKEQQQKEIIVPAPNGTSFAIKPEMGLCARALYDYQAADESEITFDPGEIITNIETIDEGWWEGMGPRGLYGLFPSNYVELLN